MNIYENTISLISNIVVFVCIAIWIAIFTYSVKKNNQAQKNKYPHESKYDTENIKLLCVLKQKSKPSVFFLSYSTSNKGQATSEWVEWEE